MLQQTTNIAIVILNYLNYLDTIECVESIFKNEYNLCGIVIVDNGSENDSYYKLKQKFNEKTDVHIIKLKKNYGFAKGNNVGIKYAREKIDADFVFVVNNDTVFLEKDYLLKLLSRYEKNVGVIGSKIILKNGKTQTVINEYLGLKDTFISFINAWSYDRGASFDFPTKQGKPEEVLHGCALLFTPCFFQYYDGFFDGTFLYGEESILKLMCKCEDIRQVYVANASIYHKEDQSSEMSFENSNSIKIKYLNQSQKYIFKWSLRYFVLKRILKRRNS